jgi:hypothetical protein
MAERELIEFWCGESKLVGSWVNPSTDPGFPLVILATGDSPSGTNGQTWQQLTPMLRSEGLGVFLFDFSGLGHSPGVYEDLTLSVGCKNFDAVMDYVQKSGIHDKERVGVIGSSYGGNIALLKAAEYPEIKAIGLKSASTFLPEGYQLQYGPELMAQWGRDGFSTEVGLKYTAVLDSLFHNTYEAASRIQAYVRIVQGTADTAVPIRHGRDLLRVLPNASMLEIEGADHWYANGDEWDRMATDIVRFMVENL